MRVLHFFSENFKRIKVVEFDPDSNMVLITGANEAGKSSVMDAIWATLQHKASKSTTIDPVRHGESHAKNILDLGKYVVTRTFRDGKSSLRIETQEGTVVKSPQSLLDDLVGSLSFDPLAFANAKDADRRKMIQDVFNLDLTEFDAKEHEVSEDRKDKKRELGMVDGKLKAIRPPTDGESDKPMSASDLIQQMTEVTTDAISFKSHSKELNEIAEKISQLEKRSETIYDEQIKIAAKYGQGNLGINTQCTWADTKIVALKEKIDNIETRNARARELTEYLKLRTIKDDLVEEIATATKRLALNKINRDEAIEAANIPIDGLEITEDGVFLKSVPFNQISSAQKIKASLAIAIAANPDLRVIRIMDGSLLDSANMKIISDMAKEHDYQIWIERVDETGKVGVVIEDGEIVAQN